MGVCDTLTHVDDAAADTDPLAATLRDTPPPAVQALPPELRERLAEQVRAGRARQRQLGEEAVASALKGVPLPVRGLLRKALG